LDYLQKTQEMLRSTELRKERIAADCNMSMWTLYKMIKPDANPTHEKLKAVYEYLSGEKMEA